MGKASEPDGGSDTNELFGLAFVSTITEILDIKSEPGLTAFIDELIAYGRSMRKTIRTTRLGFSISPPKIANSKRVQWLDANVIGPCEKLVSAFSPESAAFLSIWPEDDHLKKPQNTKDILESIEVLMRFGNDLRLALTNQIDDGINYPQEMRYAIVNDLTHIVRGHFPETIITRGTYDKIKGKMMGRFP